MSRKAREGTLRVLALLTMLQGGCWADPELVEVGQCGPGDSSPECCLKVNPGQWDRCTGSPEPGRRVVSVATQLGAATMAGVTALQPVIGTSERRGVELATDLSVKVEEALVRCVREADRWVNEYHFQGKSPSAELCGQLRLGEKTTWAAYLGLFKHEQSWACLHAALKTLMPGRYWLEPRFRLDERTGQWEYLTEDVIRDIMARQGWTGLTGTIAPDVVLLDEKGIIVRVYDLKFPCPSSNQARWERYAKGPWRDWGQGELYEEVLKTEPDLVSPREGISKHFKP